VAPDRAGPGDPEPAPDDHPGRAPAGAAGATDDGLLEIGRIGRAHGLRGEVVVHPTSNRAGRFAPGSTLEGRPVRGPARDLVVGTSRALKDKWVVGFVGSTDRTTAEALRGTTLHALPLVDELDDDELWVHELIGSTVWHGERELGLIVSVEANPAHDLLVLESGALIPVVFVTAAAPGRVDVDVPAGLVE
jgi:16S rRNA processing protein RimM